MSIVTDAGAVMSDPSYSPTGYSHIYKDWDVNESTFVSAYLVMVVGIVCAALTWKSHGGKGADLYSLGVQFVLYSLFEGLSFGFAGAAHQVLAYYDSNGIIMSRHFFAPHAEWLCVWALALLLAPVATGSLAGTTFAYSNTATGWIRWAKVFGVLIGIVELYLCFVNIDATGKITMYWGFALSCLGLVLCVKEGCRASLPMIVGCTFRALSFLVIALTPPGCWSSEDADSFCPYPPEFNQRAVFNVFNVGAIVFIHAGVLAKLKAADTYVPASGSGTMRRCCPT
mmetsp:Transcript_96572/g.270321  ORF Transcript_96572/g.270321 Transcript_96572/m.270321 type:complete len:284 (-) Transcript_96572:227-1078(-)